VLDVYMPGYGGLEVCQRLKESGETMRIPVLLTVGKMEPFKAEEAKRVRADAHIVKPFEASELLAALAKLEDRIVPQADASRGRKSKKPSFWHDDDPSAARDWTENAEYLAQVKQRKRNEEPDPPVEVVVELPAPTESSPKVGAFPLVPEATEELPVIADSPLPDEASDESAVQEATSTVAVVEVAQVEVDRSGAKVESEGLDSASARDAVPDVSTASSSAGAADSAVSANGRWIAENVAVTPEEAALELEREMRDAEAGNGPSATQASTGAAQLDAPETRGATFAAAAGASGSVTTTAVSPADEAETAVAPEAVAAWENWQHIRDTVMNAHNTAAIAEQVAQAAIPQAAVPQVAPTDAAQEAATAQPSSEASSSSNLEIDALAGIVDSVLADLKPKLMEEIAKKLKK
jgi:hypothetical protein